MFLGTTTHPRIFGLHICLNVGEGLKVEQEGKWIVNS